MIRRHRRKVLGRKLSRNSPAAAAVWLLADGRRAYSPGRQHDAVGQVSLPGRRLCWARHRVRTGLGSWLVPETFAGFSGDPAVLGRLMSLTDNPDPDFAIVTP